MTRIRPYFDTIVAESAPYKWETTELKFGGVASACVRMMKPYSKWFSVYDGSGIQDSLRKGSSVRSAGREPGSHVVTGNLPGKRGTQIGLVIDRKESKGHYLYISNGVIWPINHDMPEHIFGYTDERYEQHYNVNRRLAAEVSGNRILINDYQLKPLVKMLRESSPEASTAFFLHTRIFSMDTYDSLVELPDHEKIQGLIKDDAEAMLYADLVGFQTPRDIERYLKAVERFVDAARIQDNSDGSFTICYNGRKVRVDAFPIGIDPETIRKYAVDTEINYVFEDSGTDLYEEFMEARNKGLVIAAKVGRLDYTKGFKENILIAEQLAGMGVPIKFFAIGAPSRENLPQYMETKSEAIRLVAEINRRNSHLGYDLIFFTDEGIRYGESMMSLMRDCDIYLDASLADGMHLTPKEAIEAKGVKEKGRGIVVIGENTGIAWQYGREGFGLQDGLVITDSRNDEVSARRIKDVLDSGYGVSDRMIKFGRRHNVNAWASNLEEGLERAVQR